MEGGAETGPVEAEAGTAEATTDAKGGSRLSESVLNRLNAN